MAGTLIEPDIAVWMEALPAATTAGAKVYPFDGVPQKTVSWPFVTYFRVACRRIRSLKGPTGVCMNLVQVDVFGKTKKSASELAEAIRLAIDALSETAIAGDRRRVQFAAVDDDADADEEPMHGDEVTQFRVTLPVRIMFEEN